MTQFYSVRAILPVKHNGVARVPGDVATQDFVVDAATKDTLFNLGKVTVNGTASAPAAYQAVTAMVDANNNGLWLDPASAQAAAASMPVGHKLQKAISAFKRKRSATAWDTGVLSPAPTLVQQATLIAGFQSAIAPNTAGIYDLMGGSMSSDSGSSLVRIDGTKYQTNVTGGWYRTVFTGQKFQVQLKDNLAYYRIRANGQWVSATYIDGTGGIVYASVDLGSYGDWLIEIEIRRNGGVKALYPSAATEQFRAPPPRLPKIAIIGDSQTADAVSDTSVGSDGDKLGINIYSAQLADMLDANVLSFAIPGTGYLAGPVALRNRLDEVIACGAAAIVIVLLTNDGSYTAAQVQAEADYCLRLLNAQLPTTPITVFGMVRSSWFSTNLDRENAVAAAVAAIGNPLIAFRPVCTGPYPFMTGTGNQNAPANNGTGDKYLGPDGTHLPLIGQKGLAKWVGDGCISHWESLAP